MPQRAENIYCSTPVITRPLLIKPERGEGSLGCSEPGVLLSDCVNKRSFFRVATYSLCLRVLLRANNYWKNLQDLQNNNALSFAFEHLLSVQTLETSQSMSAWNKHIDHIMAGLKQEQLFVVLCFSCGTKKVLFHTSGSQEKPKSVTQTIKKHSF